MFKCIVVLYRTKVLKGKKWFLKWQRLHQVMNVGGWTHVTVCASVHLVTFVQVCDIPAPMLAFQPNFGSVHPPFDAPGQTEW